ncbi:hypothetical protein ACFOD9_01705 [Novosphingobium bradum]|uniref:Glycerophosphoryl diester phosphodiesterase membrane domain-containing protein n=1 Tax=Novosphingobium bradum TaxID=1737444 RepID=A0ABV7IL50_9SPHN
MTAARPRPHVPFDSNRAWTRAAAAIRANREVVFALAGVFFLLPSLALALLFPQPEPTSVQAMMAQMEHQPPQQLAVQVLVMLLQAAGTLGLLTLLTDRARPTVGEAIRAGFAALLPYIASQVILGMGLGMVFLILAGLFGALGAPAVGLAACAALALPVMIRFALTAPVVAIEKWRNPLAALRRAWQLTKGNTLRVLGFFALILLVFVVVISVISGLSGIVLALLLPATLAAIIGKVIAAALGAGMVVVMVACLAATHAQLAGGKTDPFDQTFG